MRPHVRRVRCIIRCFTLTAGSLVLLCVIIMKETSIKELTELDKCPACYGVTFCPQINSGLIQLNPFSSWFNVKNVFFGHSPSGKITLKKLGHNWELSELDKNICQLMGHAIDDCVISDIIWRLQDVKSAMFNVLRSNRTFLPKRSEFKFCPAVEASQLDELIDRVSMRSKGIGYKTLLTNILTTLIINPEPLLLQSFPADEGWPFPQYLGACGRVTAQEYAGSSIVKLLTESWLSRANAALQLLQAARQLTFQDPHYALYLTDVSYDNIVVDNNGKLSIVDLGNIIVLDKNPPLSARPVYWKEMHNSDSVDICDNCFAYSVEDVCSHQISDHNYWAVCQFLAEHHWLEDAPTKVIRAYPKFYNLLHECHKPETLNGRYISVRHLLKILTNITTWHSL